MKLVQSKKIDKARRSAAKGRDEGRTPKSNPNRSGSVSSSGKGSKGQSKSSAEDNSAFGKVMAAKDQINPKRNRPTKTAPAKKISSAVGGPSVSGLPHLAQGEKEGEEVVLDPQLATADEGDGHTHTVVAQVHSNPAHDSERNLSEGENTDDYTIREDRKSSDGDGRPTRLSRSRSRSRSHSRSRREKFPRRESRRRSPTPQSRRSRSRTRDRDYHHGRNPSHSRSRSRSSSPSPSRRRRSPSRYERSKYVSYRREESQPYPRYRHRSRTRSARPEDPEVIQRILHLEACLTATQEALDRRGSDSAATFVRPANPPPQKRPVSAAAGSAEAAIRAGPPIIPNLVDDEEARESDGEPEHGDTLSLQPGLAETQEWASRSQSGDDHLSDADSAVVQLNRVDAWRESFRSDKFRIRVPQDFGPVLSFLGKTLTFLNAEMPEVETGKDNPSYIFKGMSKTGWSATAPRIPLDPIAIEVIRKDEKRLRQGTQTFGEKRYSDAFPSTKAHEAEFFGPCLVGDDYLKLVRGTIKPDATDKKYLTDAKLAAAEALDKREDEDLGHLMRLNNTLLAAQGFIGGALVARASDTDKHESEEEFPSHMVKDASELAAFCALHSMRLTAKIRTTINLGRRERLLSAFSGKFSLGKHTEALVKDLPFFGKDLFDGRLTEIVDQAADSAVAIKEVLGAFPSMAPKSSQTGVKRRERRKKAAKGTGGNPGAPPTQAKPASQGGRGQTPEKDGGAQQQNRPPMGRGRGQNSNRQPWNKSPNKPGQGGPKGKQA